MSSGQKKNSETVPTVLNAYGFLALIILVAPFPLLPSPYIDTSSIPFPQVRHPCSMDRIFLVFGLVKSCKHSLKRSNFVPPRPVHPGPLNSKSSLKIKFRRSNKSIIQLETFKMWSHFRTPRIFPTSISEPNI